MLDIGFLELMIIGIVGLLVLGPERLPRAARTAGMWIGKIKRTVSGMQREISAQLETEELRQKINEQQKKLDDSLKKAKLDVESIADAPPGEGASPDDKAVPSETEQRVAKATARLDDALQTVREESPTSAAKSEPAQAETKQDKVDEKAALKQAEPEKAESEKDRNHQ
ncbi:MAG: twin-arginine translocase subunit TatB [Halomonas sp.]|nr:Sec-independent protein translocase protein TatB [Halomonas sp.]TVP50724.1 MAG: twin-arginine translocase subunit TatB [Halomonas sp.]